MSGRTLSYYFTLQSPWSYLGHAEAMAITARHRLQVLWKPINLLAVFPESGGLPLAKRHPKRQAYRDIELRRWRDKRGMSLNLRPQFWPIDIALADRTVIALAEEGVDPDAFVRAAFAGLWVKDADLTSAATIGDFLAATGSDARALAAAQSQATGDLYESNTREALDAGVFGAPTFIFDGEPFWGQDRLSLLDDALSSGREPFLP